MIMGKVIKIGFVSLFMTCLLGAGLLFYALKTSSVERLLKDYPRWDSKKKVYVLDSKMPSSWVDLGDVSERAKWAVIVSEDWAFYQHSGVDLEQLKIALKESWAAGEFTRGASTITQQVIKNCVLTDERTLWRKLQEVVLALYLEKIATKDRILELYLNIIELGEGIYGVKDASRYYFSKPPSQLEAREGAFLAMLLPSPVKYSISFDKKELTEFASEVVDSILVKMRQAGVYSEQERLIEARKKFFWEKDFYRQGAGEDSENGSAYDDYLEDSFL